MDNNYRSEFLGSLHETAVGLHKIGVISDAEMREYDRDCLAPEDAPPATPAPAGRAHPATA